MDAEIAWRRARAAARGFGVARRHSVFNAWRRRMGRVLSGIKPCCEECCDALLCFERSGTSKTNFHSGNKRTYETVKIAEIVGSLGRCSAFDGDFMPTCSCTRDRWERVYSAMHEGRSLPPVELYLRDGEYYVVDGNHRVSVAKSMGLEHIEALVTDIRSVRES